MAEAQFSFETEVLPVVKLWAAKRFAGHVHREERILDSLSVAWEIWQKAPEDATPSTIARFAVLTAGAQRHVNRSMRSLDSHKRMQRTETARDYEFDVNQLGNDRDDPAEIAAFRIDFSQWLASLKERDRTIAEMFARGDTTTEVAQQLGCTSGNVSQYRARLAANWSAYLA